MNKKIQSIILYTSGSFFILTLFAWIIRSSTFMCIIGLVLFGLVMFPIVFAKAIKKVGLFTLKIVDERDLVISNLKNSSIVRFGQKYPEFFRAIVQTIGFWIVEVYSDLSSFKVDFIKSIDLPGLLFSLILLVSGFLGQFLRKNKPRKFYMWISDVMGNVSFFRGLFLLLIGVFFNSAYNAFYDFFSTFLFFLDFRLIVHVTSKLDLFGLLVICIIPFVCIFSLPKIIRDPLKSTSEKDLAWGFLFFNIWISAIPIIEIYVIIKYYLEHKNH